MKYLGETSAILATIVFLYAFAAPEAFVDWILVLRGAFQ